MQVSCWQVQCWRLRITVFRFNQVTATATCKLEKRQAATPLPLVAPRHTSPNHVRTVLTFPLLTCAQTNPRPGCVYLPTGLPTTSYELACARTAHLDRYRLDVAR